MSKKLHCLAQGKEGVTVGTNTIFYLTHAEIRCIPKDWTVTHTCIVIDHRPQKDDPNQFRITVGSNLIDYPYKLTTRTADMVSAKIMWNSVISSPGAKVGGAKIKKMYLKTPLNWYNYMQMPLKLFLDNIIDHYNLHEKALNGFVYVGTKTCKIPLPVMDMPVHVLGSVHVLAFFGSIIRTVLNYRVPICANYQF